MEGLIKIEDYKIQCILGSEAFKQDRVQEVALDIEMRLDFTECAQTDSIVDTVNYMEITRVCQELAKSRRYHLLETLAFEAIHTLKESFSPLYIKVRAKQKGALPLANQVIVEFEL